MIRDGDHREADSDKRPCDPCQTSECVPHTVRCEPSRDQNEGEDRRSKNRQCFKVHISNPAATAAVRYPAGGYRS